jgi:hypothetical protein
MEEMSKLYKIMVGKLDRKRSFEDLVIDRRIILEWILKKQVWSA